MPVAILTPDRPARPRVQQLASGLQIISNKQVTRVCRCCQRGFFEDQERQWIQHVIACAKEHEEQIREAHDIGHQMPGLFGPEAGDVEKKTWLRERKGWRV